MNEFQGNFSNTMMGRQVLGLLGSSRDHMCVCSSGPTRCSYLILHRSLYRVRPAGDKQMGIRLRILPWCPAKDIAMVTIRWVRSRGLLYQSQCQVLCITANTSLRIPRKCPAIDRVTTWRVQGVSSSGLHIMREMSLKV